MEARLDKETAQREREAVLEVKEVLKQEQENKIAIAKARAEAEAISLRFKAEADGLKTKAEAIKEMNEAGQFQ